MRDCLGPAKMQYSTRTPPLRHTAAFAEWITLTQRATGSTVVGTPVSATAWVQATLLIGEGGCGLASASDVAPVARIAGILQLLARVEPMLDCDRQCFVPLATKVGQLDALNARLPRRYNPLRAGRARVRWNCPTWTSGAKLVVIEGDPSESGRHPRGGHRAGCPPAGGTACGQGGRMAVSPTHPVAGQGLCHARWPGSWRL